VERRAPSVVPSRGQLVGTPLEQFAIGFEPVVQSGAIHRDNTHVRSRNGDGVNVRHPSGAHYRRK
jgi:hypothetical protein